MRTQNRHSGRVPVDWRDRFIRAYDAELQEWLNAVAGGHVHRPDLLGRLRRRRGHGRRPRGAPHRPAHRGFHARTSGVLRQMRDRPRPLHVPPGPADRSARRWSRTWVTSTSSCRRATDFMPFFLHPRADRAQIAAFSRALNAAGVQVASVLPLYRWSGPDEDERQAAVRYWKRAIQITADLGVNVMNSEFNGRPEAAAASEAQFWRSMEELLPVFEREGVRLVLEPHPDDFIEDGTGGRRPHPRHRQGLGLVPVLRAAHLSPGRRHRRHHEVRRRRCSPICTSPIPSTIAPPPGCATSSTRPVRPPGSTSTWTSVRARWTGTSSSGPSPR